MSDPTPTHPAAAATTSTALKLLRRLAGLSILLISISFILISILHVALIALIVSTPLIIITSPIWVPLAVSLVCLCVFVVGSAAATWWIYRYFRGMNPPGWGRVRYARIRMTETANRLRERAREAGVIGGKKSKDVAPGA